MTTKEQAIEQIWRIIAEINPATEEMKTVIFYLRVADNYINNMPDSPDYIDGKIAAYEEVLRMFNTHQEPGTVPGSIRLILESLK